MKIVKDLKSFTRYGSDRYKMVKEYGYDGVSLAMCDTTREWYTLPLKESDAYLTSERKAAENDGVTFTHGHGPWRVPWNDVTPEGLEEKIGHTKRAIHNTAVFGGKYCVIHPFLPMDINEINDPEKAKITYDTNRRILLDVTNFAKSEGVIVCFENMPMLNFSMAKPADIVRIVEDINDPYLMTCFDTGHANIYRELNIEDSIRTMSKTMRVIHAHDNFYNMDMHLFPYHGNTDWSAFSRALKEINYDGILELEISVKQDMPEHLYAASNKLLKDTIDYIVSIAYQED